MEHTCTKRRRKAQASSPGPPSSPSAPDISTDDQWADAAEGDFEVVTSDNVRFLVPSYMLFGASALFRDAQNHPAPDADTCLRNGGTASAYSVHLLDPTIETAPVFRLFLLLIAEGGLEDSYWLPHTHLLSAFLRKWECDVASRHLDLMLLQSAVDHHLSPLRVWAIGAAAGDRALCMRVLAKCTFTPWSTFHHYGDGELSPEWETHGEDGHPLDPGQWPMYMWTDVPAPWAMALTRTWGQCSDIAVQMTEKGAPPGETYYTVFLRWLDKLVGAQATHVACARLLREDEHQQ